MRPIAPVVAALQRAQQPLNPFERCFAASGGRVLVADAWNVTPHLETSLEIALRLARAGYGVDYLHYGGRLPSVEFFFRDRLRLKELLSFTLAPQRKGRRILRGVARALGLDLRVIQAPLGLFLVPFNPPLPVAALESLEALKQHQPADYPSLGPAVVSSLVSRLQDSGLRPRAHARCCQQLAVSYVRAHRAVASALSQSRYQALIVFNGRFACLKGAVDAASAAGVPVWYQERGSSLARFSLRPFQPQDRLALQEEMLQLWEAVGDGLAAHSQAAAFFTERRAGSTRQWLSFTDHQQTGHAAAVLAAARASAPSGRVITFFAGSDDECVSVDDVYGRDPRPWVNQAEALQALVRVAAPLGHAVVVRCHPHLQHKHDGERQRWDQLTVLSADARRTVRVVASDSAVSSYELIDGSDLIASYGSTVGIEAVFWGKPSLLLGNSFYDRLGATLLQPDGWEALERDLRHFPSYAVDRFSALPYGYYQQTFGIDYCIYQPTSLFDGTFGGSKLQTFDRSPLFRTAEDLAQAGRRLTARVWGPVRSARG